MTILDKWLQRWRIRKALQYIEPGSRVLDIGCLDGEFFRTGAKKIGVGVGIDPKLDSDYADSRSPSHSRVKFVRGLFPRDLPGDERFEFLTLLAVLEHIPDDEIPDFLSGCSERLKRGGKAVVTVPSVWVDHILTMLIFLRLVDGLSVHEHHGFDVRKIAGLFEAQGFKLLCHRKFQFGLNNLFVFEKQ